MTEIPGALPAVRLLEVKFATAAAAGTAQRTVRVALGRVDELFIFRQPNDEFVIGIWLARVFGLHPKIDVPEVVRLGRTTDLTGPPELAVAVGWELVDEDVGRDAGGVDVQACAFVDVFEMAPGRPILASGGDAELRLGGAVCAACRGDDVALTVQVVARRRLIPGPGGAGGGEHQRCDCKSSDSPTHHSSSRAHPATS